MTTRYHPKLAYATTGCCCSECETHRWAADHGYTLYNINREASTVADMSEHRNAYPNCPKCKADARNTKEALDAAEEANRQADAEADAIDADMGVTRDALGHPIIEGASVVHVLPSDVLVFTGVGDLSGAYDTSEYAQRFGVKHVIFFANDAAMTVVRKAVEAAE